MTFDVVVPYIDGALLQTMRLIDSVRRNTVRPQRIIFVGRASDGTTEWLKTQRDVTVVENNVDQPSYGVNVNLGIRFSTAPLIFVCNNDIVLPAVFFEEMLDTYLAVREMAHVGMIGPRSNFVMAPQTLVTEQPLEVDGVNEKLSGRPFFSPIISGFCFLCERGAFLDCGGFHGELENGCEDVELSWKFLKAGQSNFIASSTYVYHEGNVSLSSEEKGGTHNRHVLARLLFSERRKPKIACYLRVKASEEEVLSWMTRHACLFDVVFVVDDGSNVNWEGVNSAFENVVVRTDLRGESEAVQRTAGISMAVDCGADAIVNLDHDEFLEPKVNRSYLERLLELPLPSTFGFVGRFLHLWNSPHTYNVTYPPQEHLFMTRLLPGIIYQYGAQGYHGARLPNFLKPHLAITNVRVIHQGYFSPEVRMRKRELYESTDKVKDPKLIGGEDYSHMTDERRLFLSKWSGCSKDYTISLNMMAENETPAELQIALENIVTAVDELVLRVPPDRDDLAEVAELFRPEVLIKEKWNEDFAEMRNRLLSESSCAYILSLDPDESVVAPGEIVELVNRQPDGARFTFIDVRGIQTQAIRLFRRDICVRWDGIVHEVPLFVHQNPEIEDAKNVIHHLSSTLDRSEFYHKLNKKMMSQCPSDVRPVLDDALRYKFEGNFVKAMQRFCAALKIAPDCLDVRREFAKFLLLYALAVGATVHADNLWIRALSSVIGPADLQVLRDGGLLKTGLGHLSPRGGNNV